MATPAEQLSSSPVNRLVGGANNTNHQRCKDCGILMGPGHLESGIAERCGSCVRARKANSPESNAAGLGRSRTVFPDRA